MPKCPYCKGSVTLGEGARERADGRQSDAGRPAVVRKEILGRVKKEIMYSCPHCDLILGFGVFSGGLLTGRP